MTRHEQNLSRNMKTTDYTLAEIDDYIAVRKLVTRKEIRLAHEYEKSLEWRHMDKLHGLSDRLENERDRYFHAYNGVTAKDNIGDWTCANSARSWPSIEHEHITKDDDGLPCMVNGIEIPKHLRRTLDLILTHGKNRQVSINLIMCDNSSNYHAAEVKYYRNISAIMAILGLPKKTDVSK